MEQTNYDLILKNQQVEQLFSQNEAQNLSKKIKNQNDLNKNTEKEIKEYESEMSALYKEKMADIKKARNISTQISEAFEKRSKQLEKTNYNLILKGDQMEQLFSQNEAQKIKNQNDLNKITE